MTAYEILKYMAWIRGTPRHRTHREVEKWLKRMDLTRYKHVKIKFYSGGTKRKLNTAIAMVKYLFYLTVPSSKETEFLGSLGGNLLNPFRSFILDCCATIDSVG